MTLNNLVQSGNSAPSLHASDLIKQIIYTGKKQHLQQVPFLTYFYDALSYKYSTINIKYIDKHFPIEERNRLWVSRL